MATAVVNGGPIDAMYINTDSIRRTVKMEITSERRLKRADLLGSLDKVPGLDLTSVTALYQKGEDSKVYYVELKTQDQTDCLVQAGRCTGSYFQAAVSPMSAQTVKIRIHWLPTYIRESFVRFVMERFGKVLTYDEDVYTDHGVHISTKTGCRTVMLQCSESQKRALPHIIKFDDGVSMLLVVQGRLPYCLKCQKIGHIRRDCPTTRGPSGLKTYARVLRKGSDDEASGDENTASESVSPENSQSDVTQGETSTPGTTDPQMKANKEATKRPLEKDNSDGDQWSTVVNRKVAKAKKGKLAERETAQSTKAPERSPDNMDTAAFAPVNEQDVEGDMELSLMSPALQIDIQGGADGAD